MSLPHSELPAAAQGRAEGAAANLFQRA